MQFSDFAVRFSRISIKQVSALGQDPESELALQQLAAAGFTPQQLQKRGYTALECREMDFAAAEVGFQGTRPLVRVAAALSVSLEELVGPPRAWAKLYRAAELPQKTRGKVLVRQLLPDTLSGLAIERMALAAGAQMTGTPHTPGTREYLTCETGRVELAAAGQRWVLEPGDVVVFRGDQKHGYRNPGRAQAVAYSVVALAPADAV